MPIPTHPLTYLVQAIFRTVGTSGNTFTNTWFFGDSASSPRSHSQVSDAVKTVLDRFYRLVNSPSTSALQTYLSPVVSTALSEYKVYDLGQAAPRTPLIRSMGLTGVSGTPMPNEVAVVMSFRSDTGNPATGGTINKRKRGRLYIGPLNTLALASTDTSKGDARVHADVRNIIRDGAKSVLNNTSDLEWLQYSRVADALDFVEGGFVGDAFDTQRRRGEPESARTLITP